MRDSEDVNNLLLVLVNNESYHSTHMRDRPNFMDKLVRLVNEVYSTVPKLGIAVDTAMSLFAARWPVGCFQSLSDPFALIPCCNKIMEEVLKTLTNHGFLSQLNWALVTFTRIIPLLYQMGSWKLIAKTDMNDEEASRSISMSSLAQKIAQFAVTLNSKRDQAEGTHDSDCRPLLDLFGAFKSIFVLVIHPSQSFQSLRY
mmetsp:Transcript_11962/g.18263  ORF Transcript_11962/g.18263 Transcript_11962/m.18263 type:complete len:200 (-) Transcript_11962:506-1105(-)